MPSDRLDSVRRALTILVLAACVLLACGYDAVPDARVEVPADTTAAENRTSWYAFPTVFYTPETSLAGGMGGGYFFALSTGRISSLQGDVSGTLRGQYGLNADVELWRHDEAQRLFLETTLSSYPDVFYGIGPHTTEDMAEDFTSRYLDAILQVEQRVVAQLRLGVRGQLRTEAVTSVEEDGLLETSVIPGQDGSTVLEVGLVGTFDTRDRVFYPNRGQYVTAYAIAMPGWFGSRFEAARTVVDARHYTPMGRGHVLALQAHGEAVQGTAPFSMLPELGGMLRMRGYRQGRYRDHVAASVQGEWRFPVWWRFDGATFAGAGAVSSRVDAFAADGLEVAGGVGVRFRLNDEGVRIRLDYAVGRDGGALYITALQPF